IAHPVGQQTLFLHRDVSVRFLATLNHNRSGNLPYNHGTMPKNTSSDLQNQFANKAQAWSARFSEPVSDLVKRYTASVDFDQRLARYDIQGSLAHADMLAAIGIITDDDKAAIE